MKLQKLLFIIFNIVLCLCLTTSSPVVYLPEPTTSPAIEYPTAPPTEPEVPTEPETAPVYCAHEEQYPTATKVWNYMKNELGWNDYVAAGVMGNLMVETGGQTLNIKWNLWDKPHEYYGICQWSKKYYPVIMDASLDEQLEFLKNTVESIFNTFGKNYAKGFKYEDFISMQNCEEAALAFAKCYERCNSKYYSIRLTSAVKAYEYYKNHTSE